MTIPKCKGGREPRLTIFVTFARKLFAIAIGLAAIPMATPARADLASLKNSCVTKFAVTTPQGPALPYTFCDDGLPPVGGRTANEGAKNAVAVPEKYLDYDEQPIKAKAEQGTGADRNGDIALDADVSIPDHKLAPQRLPLDRDAARMLLGRQDSVGGARYRALEPRKQDR